MPYYSYVSITDVPGQPYFMLYVTDPDVLTATGDTEVAYTITTILVDYPGVSLTFDVLITFTCPDTPTSS